MLHTVQTLHELGFGLRAEGEFCKGIGCDAVQGDLFGHSMAEGDLIIATT